jgi:hypothetical protein
VSDLREITACRCMCSPCGHKSHCGGEVCSHRYSIDDDKCGWCRRPIDDCLSDTCEDAAEFYEAEFG